MSIYASTLTLHTKTVYDDFCEEIEHSDVLRFLFEIERFATNRVTLKICKYCTTTSKLHDGFIFGMISCSYPPYFDDDFFSSRTMDGNCRLCQNFGILNPLPETLQDLSLLETAFLFLLICTESVLNLIGKSGI